MRKLQLNLSPINQRRWESFKANRRGLWSLRIFLVMFLVTLCAEFIANDKPLILLYDGSLYAPVFFSYPETAFGGDFETEADYRDPYVKKLIEDKGGYSGHRLNIPTTQSISILLFPPQHHQMVKTGWVLTIKGGMCWRG